MTQILEMAGKGAEIYLAAKQMNSCRIPAEN
jgi:hypothetical protein